MTPTDDVLAQRKKVLAEAYRLAAQKSPDIRRVDFVIERYQALLPDVTIARDPHSGELMRWPIDVFGLDGLYWDYINPVTRLPSSMPRSWLAMTGAMRLADPVEHPPFAVVPGPEVPFVVPRILTSPGVIAVLAEVPVGTHTGWAISYFGPKPAGVNLVNLWGNNTYPVYRDGDYAGWNWDRPTVAQYDFELEPWLRTGKLLWLQPGDESATLREGLGGCPFVGMTGRRLITVIANGAIQHVGAFAGHGAG